MYIRGTQGQINGQPDFSSLIRNVNLLLTTIFDSPLPFRPLQGKKEVRCPDVDSTCKS